MTGHACLLMGMQKTAIILIPATLLLGLGLSACADSDTDTGITTNTVAPGSTMSPSLAPTMGGTPSGTSS